MDLFSMRQFKQKIVITNYLTKQKSFCYSHNITTLEKELQDKERVKYAKLKVKIFVQHIELIVFKCK